MRAYIVVDLGFGDAGKGLLTDFLARQLKAGVVVRYNGGAQAGHNVVAPDGRHHTFAQFGSGTFIPGVKTYLSRHVVVHPGALLVEGDLLVQQGVRDAFARLRLSEQALVITPFHQAANRIREIARGTNRHGSCGTGVGEAVEDARLPGSEWVSAGDLANPTRLRRKLRSIREYKRAQIGALCNENCEEPSAREWAIFEREDVIEAWISSISRINALGLVTSDEVLERWLHESETAIFEGAQGVLLDADAGFHPYTTWSRCTAANALELLKETAPEAQVFQLGVMRCYAVRHGPGPLPTETDSFASAVLEHNRYNEWQGAVRYGWFDAVLARYALGVTGGVKALVVTHMDVLSRLKMWNYCPGYQGWHAFDGASAAVTISDGILTEFRLPPFLSLAQRTELTQALTTTVRPELGACVAAEEAVVREIESLTGQPVGIISRGPGAGDVRLLNPIPA